MRKRNLTTHCPYPIKESFQTNNLALFIFPLHIWIEVIDVSDHYNCLLRAESLDYKNKIIFVRLWYFFLSTCITTNNQIESVLLTSALRCCFSQEYIYIRCIFFLIF